MRDVALWIAVVVALIGGTAAVCGIVTLIRWARDPIFTETLERLTQVQANLDISIWEDELTIHGDES